MSGKTSNLNIRINSELKQKIVNEAQKLGMTLTEFVEFRLNELDMENSGGAFSENILKGIESAIQRNTILTEIKSVTGQNLQNSIKILNSIRVPDNEGTVKLDEDIEQKLNDLLEIMKHDIVRYQKDGVSLEGDAKTPSDVLNMIVHNYHSLIVNE